MRETREEKLGNCFETAVMGPKWKRWDGSIDLTVVHGVVVGDCRHVHAWNELTEFGEPWVLDLSNDAFIKLPQDAYYRLGQVELESVVRYSMEEARKLCIKHGHFGPWEEHLEALS